MKDQGSVYQRMHCPRIYYLILFQLFLHLVCLRDKVNTLHRFMNFLKNILEKALNSYINNKN